MLLRNYIHLSSSIIYLYEIRAKFVLFICFIYCKHPLLGAFIFSCVTLHNPADALDLYIFLYIICALKVN